jgi:ferritin
MLKASVLKALNEQVNAEYYSAYLYLEMSAYADSAGFKGASGWLWHQSREEASHGSKILKYILDQGGKATFSDIKATGASYKSLKEVFAKVAAHEKHVTDLFNALADLAQKEHDHATYHLLQWFVDEQIEEVSTADDILNKLNAIGDNPGLLYNFDAVLAQRKGN